MESPREYYQALCDGPPIELAPGLYQLTIPLPFRLNHVHVYLVEADDGFMLIDTGVNTSEAFSSLNAQVGRHWPGFPGDHAGGHHAFP